MQEHYIKHTLRVLIFSTSFIRNISHSYLADIMILHRYSCQVSAILILFWSSSNFLGRLLEKSSNVTFRETPFSGSRVVTYGQTDRRTDRHDEATCLFFILRTRLKTTFYIRQKNTISETVMAIYDIQIFILQFSCGTPILLSTSRFRIAPQSTDMTIADSFVSYCFIVVYKYLPYLEICVQLRKLFLCVIVVGVCNCC